MKFSAILCNGLNIPQYIVFVKSFLPFELVLPGLRFLDFSLSIGYTIQGKQQITGFVKAECFPQEVSALIVSKTGCR